MSGAGVAAVCFVGGIQRRPASSSAEPVRRLARPDFWQPGSSPIRRRCFSIGGAPIFRRGPFKFFSGDGRQAAGTQTPRTALLSFGCQCTSNLDFGGKKEMYACSNPLPPSQNKKKIKCLRVSSIRYLQIELIKTLMMSVFILKYALSTTSQCMQ